MTERGLKILNVLGRRGAAQVSALAGELGVSAVTVRKDLDLLEQSGLLTRQHGYAVSVSPNDIRYRMIFNYDVKLRIARRAAELVDGGETIMIESGSTCAMLAQTVAETKKDAMIITNSAFIAEFIRRTPGARVTLLGGVYDNDAQVTTGSMVKLCADMFRVDKFFLGTDGYEMQQGFSSMDLQRADAVRAMAGSARQCMVLTDAGKFNQRSVVSLLRAEEVSAVITDAIPENCRAALEEKGVRLLFA